MALTMPPTYNFLPIYREALLDGTKTTTVRLGDGPDVKVDDIFNVTCGWADDADARELLFVAKVTYAATKKVASIQSRELAGETPDCRRCKAVPFVVGALYHRVLTPDTLIRIVQFERVDGKATTSDLSEDPIE